MYDQHEFCTAHTILPHDSPFMTTRPRGRRRRRRHVPHAQRPADVVDRRNARERRRVNDVNAAFLELQVHLPSSTSQEEQTTSPPSPSSSDLSNGQKKLSKIKILHDAIDYIAQLTSILNLSAYTTNTGSGPGNTSEVPLDPPGGYCTEFLQGGDRRQGQVEETGFCSRVLVCDGGRMPLHSSMGEYADRWSSTPTNQYWLNSQEISSSWNQQSSTQIEGNYNRWKTDYMHVDAPYLVIQPNN